MTPLLIQVGEKDERVPAEQSISVLRGGTRHRKVETKLVVYPRQPHGVREPRLVRDLLIPNVEWFERFVPILATASQRPWGFPNGPRRLKVVTVAFMLLSGLSRWARRLQVSRHA